MHNKKNKKIVELDDVDIAIIEELRKNPRESLRVISKKLNKQDLNASAETVRKRIENLKGSMEFQLMPDFDVFGLDNAVLLIKINGADKARKKVIERLYKINCFGVAETIGSYDLFGFTAIRSGPELGKIIDFIKTLPEVEDINYLLITKSHTTLTPVFHKLKKQIQKSSKKNSKSL